MGLLIGIAQAGGPRVHPVENGNIAQQPITGKVSPKLKQKQVSITISGRKHTRTYVDEGRSTVGELVVDTRGRVSADTSPVERPKVLRAFALPVIPQLIDHL